MRRFASLYKVVTARSKYGSLYKTSATQCEAVRVPIKCWEFVLERQNRFFDNMLVGKLVRVVNNDGPTTLLIEAVWSMLLNEHLF